MRNYNRLADALPSLLVAYAALLGLLAPLDEIDLPQHLATGEWILQHGAVPWTEPFAWTRAGQPYYAYLWLAQVTYFWLMRSFGPWGLHVLEAAVCGVAAYATLWSAKQFGW